MGRRERPRDVGVVVLGAGPTGLGATWRLEELARGGEARAADWLLVEAGRAPGGLASSEVDAEGFRWDLGGHVLFSHYADFDAVLSELLAPDEWLWHERERWVRLAGRWLPYPVQRNLHRLPTDDLVRCIRGLLEARERAADAAPPEHFEAWSRAAFGDPLHELFFAPFNRKMWATEPRDMDVAWTAGRSGSGHANVPRVDVARLVENALRGTDDPGWRNDLRFPYPREGGTGAIWRRALERLPRERVRLGARVVRVRAGERRLALADGTEIRYDALVSGIPLDLLLGCVDDRPRLAERARALRHTSVHAIGLGFDGELPDELAGKCWLYFGDAELPFYRGTILSTYSPENVPEPGRQWSLLLEVATTRDRRLDPDELVGACETALREAGVVPLECRTRSRWHHYLPRGYPVPTLGRDDALRAIDEELRAARIWSRGRFGGWRYEVSNQDHSFMQGLEAVDAALLGVDETTWFDCELANSGAAPRRLLAGARGTA